jgi:FixJ family two-component response regulator
MPGMTGPDLLQELMIRQRKIPIVFITARSDETIRRQLITAGAVDCLFEPFTETDLLAALNTALEAS